MFENTPTNPQIVADILKLSDGWKELLGPETAPKKSARRPSKKASKSKGGAAANLG